MNTDNSQSCALGPSPSVRRHVALYLNPHNNPGKLIFTSGTLELEEAEKNNKKQDKQKPTKTPKPEHWKIPLPSFSILVCTESHSSIALKISTIMKDDSLKDWVYGKTVVYVWPSLLAFEGMKAFEAFPWSGLEASLFWEMVSSFLFLECRIHSSSLLYLGNFEGTFLARQKSTNTITWF